MSYMNCLETNARNYVAMSVLNSFRHWLTGRPNAEFSKEQRSIFRDSVDMNQEQKLSSKMILYSFQGLATDDSDSAAAVDLYDALSKALEIDGSDREKTILLHKLKDILEKDSVNDIDSETKSDLLSLIIKTMKIIGSSSPQNSKTSIKWKTI